MAEYRWGAAHCFHKPGTAEAEAWVAGHLTTILHGQAACAAAEMTGQADRARCCHPAPTTPGCRL
ncbi:hypothetical protein ACWGDX_01685 [Streptomyces sp. NPDC055025]